MRVRSKGPNANQYAICKPVIPAVEKKGSQEKGAESGLVVVGAILHRIASEDHSDLVTRTEGDLVNEVRMGTKLPSGGKLCRQREANAMTPRQEHVWYV